jgi:hypothetical protein
VVHTCNPSTWEAETGRLKCEASLGYLVSPSQNNHKVSRMVLQACAVPSAGHCCKRHPCYFICIKPVLLVQKLS